MQVIRIVGEAIPHGWRTCPESDRFITAFDPDGYEGWGKFTTSERIDLAVRFPSAAAAVGFWRQQSRKRPFRDDGEPNRPLTGFTIEILDLDAIERGLGVRVGP